MKKPQTIIHHGLLAGLFFLMLLAASQLQAQCEATTNPTEAQIRDCFRAQEAAARKNFTTAAAALRPMVGKASSAYNEREKSIAKTLAFWLKIRTWRHKWLIPYIIKTFEKAAALPKLTYMAQGEDGFPCDCSKAAACVNGTKPVIHVCTASYQWKQICKIELLMHEMLHIVGLADSYNYPDVDKRHEIALRTTDAGCMAECALAIAKGRDYDFHSPGQDYCGYDSNPDKISGKGIKDPENIRIDPPSQAEAAVDAEAERFFCGFFTDESSAAVWDSLNGVLIADVEKAIEDAGEAPREEEKKEETPAEEKKEEAPAEEKQEAPAENNEAIDGDGGGKP